MESNYPLQDSIDTTLNAWNSINKTIPSYPIDKACEKATLLKNILENEAKKNKINLTTYATLVIDYCRKINMNELIFFINASLLPNKKSEATHE